MRIGIYSLPFHSNYGGILQSYALSEFLQRQGHVVFVLNRNWIDTIGKKESILKCIYDFTNNFTTTKRYVNREVLRMSIIELRRFWRSEITNVIDFKNFDEISKLDLDAIIVGSDQVWRKGYCDDTSWYFLSFAKNWNIKRIAYAASFGVGEWQFDSEQTLLLKELSKKFNGISVREADAVSLCKHYLDIEACQVLDPTLLLNKIDYCKFQRYPKKTGIKLLVSFMLHPNPDKEALSKNVADSLGASFYSVDIPYEKKDKYLSIEEWLTGLLNADYVLTDSYHGVIFSLNFNIPFVTLGNHQGGQARFESIINTFKLPNRIATTYGDIIALFEENINWKNVNQILKEMRLKSQMFIFDSLNNG